MPPADQPATDRPAPAPRTGDGPAGGRGGGARLNADDRRRQLVGIGLSLLAAKPIQQLTVEEVARAAGISRNLLFHYFASKREFYAAVVAAACRRLLRHCREAAGGPPAGRLTGFVDAYVRFIARHPESYASVIRASGGDEWVHDVWEDTRAQLAGTVLALLGRDADATPLLRQAVRGWLSMVEETTLSWTTQPTVPQPVVVRLLATACEQIAALATAPERDPG